MKTSTKSSLTLLALTMEFFIIGITLNLSPYVTGLLYFIAGIIYVLGRKFARQEVLEITKQTITTIFIFYFFMNSDDNKTPAKWFCKFKCNNTH